MTVTRVGETNTLEENISGFLTVDAQLCHSQEALTRVIAKLKSILTKLILKRKSSGSRPMTRPSRAGSRLSRLPSRSSNSTVNCPNEIPLRIHNESDTYLNSHNLLNQAICAPAPFLMGASTRPSTANSYSTLEPGQDGWVPPNILNRISLKVQESRARRPMTCQTPDMARREKSRRYSRSESADITTANILDINFLKLKIHELKTAEALALRKSRDYSPKRLLSEYSPYGIRVNRNWKPLKQTNEAAKELVGLIDRIDQQLSSNEALTTLKELGIDYQPRSAFGRKNMMANDFSMALSPNGFRLNDGGGSSPLANMDASGRTSDSFTSIR